MSSRSAIWYARERQRERERERREREREKEREASPSQAGFVQALKQPHPPIVDKIQHTVYHMRHCSTFQEEGPEMAFLLDHHISKVRIGCHSKYISRPCNTCD
jgi:hypothetical protein